MCVGMTWHTYPQIVHLYIEYCAMEQMGRKFYYTKRGETPWACLHPFFTFILDFYDCD
jgi:hypothetical protein